MLLRLAPCLVFLAGLLSTVPAAAQSVTLLQGTQGVIRRKTDALLDSDQINRQNCLDDELITFAMTVSGGGSNRLGAWTGSGCETEANRVGVNATCRRVGADMAWEVNSKLSVTVQEIIAAVNQTSAVDEGTAGAGGDNPDVCDGSAQPVGFTLYFLLTDSAGRFSGNQTVAQWPAKFDLKGPGAPTGVSAGVGENRLIVSWTAPSDTQESEIEGFYFFCDPPPGTGSPAGDAGTQSCGEPVQQDANACGRALGGSVTNGETSVLANGVSYGVSVAGRDTFRNYGELSDRICATPQPVTGFFEAYRAAGGKGGGGFCSVGAGRSSALAGFAALTLLGLSLRRRAARARKGEPS